MSHVSNHIDDLSKRVSHYRRAFVRGLGRKPTPLQNVAITAAATLTARAEIAANDPTVSPNDIVRLTGAAQRARLAMETALAPSRRDRPTLGSILRGEGARA